MFFDRKMIRESATNIKVSPADNPNKSDLPALDRTDTLPFHNSPNWSHAKIYIPCITPHAMNVQFAPCQRPLTAIVVMVVSGSI